MIFYGTFLVLTNISDKSIKNYLFNSFIFLIAVFVGSSLNQISGIEAQKTFLLLLVYGFIACVGLVYLSKLMRSWIGKNVLMRDEDYWEKK